MPKIGIIYGMENTFPAALVDRINSRNIPDVTAEHLKLGAIQMAEPSGYRVIIDRISHDIEFYRAYLKNAVLGGTIVINNPFWWSADDKFFNYALASKLGVAIPRTVILPQKLHPPGTTVQSMRNMMFPLNWDEVFDYIKFPAFLKPYNGGGWKNVYRVTSREDFFAAYDETGTLCMTLQAEVNFEEYYRCYVINQQKVRVMKYDPKQPHHLRYVADGKASTEALQERMVNDALTLCRALGYDLNTVEFGVEDGVPFAIDFLNPAPDADVYSVGQANFDWVVEAVADMAIEKALSTEQATEQYHWGRFLGGGSKTKSAAVSS